MKIADNFCNINYLIQKIWNKIKICGKMVNKTRSARKDKGKEPNEELDTKGYELFLTIIKDIIKMLKKNKK